MTNVILYRVFDTEQEALEAESQCIINLGLPKVGVNAKTGLPEPNKQITTRWSIPQQIQDGRWVFICPDGEGVEAGPDWFPVPEEL